MGLYVKNSLNTKTLFSQPENVLKKTTLFQRPSSEYQATYFAEAAIQTPVRVEVNERTMTLANSTTSVNSGIDDATTRNNLIEAYVTEAITLLDNLEDLAEYAEQSSLTSEDRAAANTKAQQILEKFDQYFEDASLGEEKLLRGGSGTISVGTDGAQIDFIYGNLNRPYLGLDSLSITTVANAETATTAIDNAQGALKSQLAKIEQTGESLLSRKSVNNEILAGEKENSEYMFSAQHAVVAQANSRAAIEEKVDYSMEIQGANIRNSTLSTMLESLAKVGEAIMRAHTDEKIKENETTNEKQDTNIEDNSENKTGNIELVNTTTISSDASGSSIYTQTTIEVETGNIQPETTPSDNPTNSQST